jgi:hypothetical protein
VDGDATLALKGFFPFRPWQRQAPPLPWSFFSDAPEKVRIEIERDSAAMRRRRTFLASNEALSGEFLCPLPLFFGFAFGD